MNVSGTGEDLARRAGMDRIKFVAVFTDEFNSVTCMEFKWIVLLMLGVNVNPDYLIEPRSMIPHPRAACTAEGVK
jgi:hypothetical protein